MTVDEIAQNIVTQLEGVRNDVPAVDRVRIVKDLINNALIETLNIQKPDRPEGSK